MDKMMQKLFINLDFGTEAQNNTVGGKVDSLLKLSLKFNVPKGFVITTFAFDEFLLSSGIAEIVKSDKATYLDFHVIRDKFKNSKLPEILLKSIEKRLASYPMFEAIGATGDTYQSQVRELITALSTLGKSPDAVKSGTIAFSNSMNQMRLSKVFK